MQLHIKGVSGVLHSMLVTGNETVGDIKKKLEELEGIPADLQVLCHAGVELKDPILLEEYEMESFNLIDEVVLYLQTRLRSPVVVFLSQASPQPLIVTEPVESFTTLDQIVNLLQLKGLAGSLKDSYCVVAKRRNGTTCPISLSFKDTVATTHRKIADAEGIEPESLTFNASHDGHLHVNVCARAETKEAQADAHSVYKRSTLPQPLLLRKSKTQGQPFNEFVKEACIMP